VPRLAQILEERRRHLGMSHQEFCRYLGISWAHWYYLRSGQRPPGTRLLQAVLRRWPDLAEIPLARLLETDGHSPRSRKRHG
jgi:transcriptional regulator with XRE-family HTH domain